MSDGLTATPTHDAPGSPAPRTGRAAWAAWAAWAAPVRQAVVILVLFAVAGLLCGWLWYHLWDVPHGVVSGGQWFTSEAGLRADFAGVAWYVSIAVLAGLVLGVLSAWLLARSELVTLAAVVTGSLVAGYLMLRLGQHLSPSDPHELAKTAADGTRLRGALRVDPWPPRAAFPFGALVGLSVVFSATAGRTPSEPAGVRPEPAPAEGTHR
jgi:hypothetical protein